ncbi:hypothetical protein [Asticcacaulis excentricus]|uniref:Uncharacterized protein n=1 Tax=Asticcacaulis excentricus TaxID=78587 RepID=A0A3G9G224_9CAUL|nr:hypothetical protein [Asticcacaulis excentricus]BBF79895.1 hypothetical protein EM6_0472 [Asticcacaulis excentricus]
MKNSLCFTTPMIDRQTIVLLKSISEAGFMFYNPQNNFQNALILNGFLKQAGIRWDRGELRPTVIITDKALETIKAYETDPRTGRKFGDHGTADQAVRFAFARDYSHHEIGEFIEAWRNGDLSEWPEFYEWLASDSQKAA